MIWLMLWYVCIRDLDMINNMAMMDCVLAGVNDQVAWINVADVKRGRNWHKNNHFATLTNIQFKSSESYKSSEATNKKFIEKIETWTNWICFLMS